MVALKAFFFSQLPTQGVRPGVRHVNARVVLAPTRAAAHAAVADLMRVDRVSYLDTIDEGSHPESFVPGRRYKTIIGRRDF